MSPPSSPRGPYRKPRPDILTLLLGLALVAIVVACIFLYLEVADYGESPFSGGPSVSLPLEQPNELAGIGPMPRHFTPYGLAAQHLRRPVHG